MFYELIKNRRSIRKFQDKMVEQGKVDIILKSALMAPSSRARKPWDFIAITDRMLLQKLSQVRENNSIFLAGAPLGIVVTANQGSSDLWIEDATIAATFVQLIAHDLGLGSCWIHIRERMNDENVTADEYVKELLGIPENYGVECILAIGYPAENKQPHNENELPIDKLHYDKF